MHHADEKRPAHGFEWMAVGVILLRFFMHVEVVVGFRIMGMRMQMNLGRGQRCAT